MGKEEIELQDIHTDFSGIKPHYPPTLSDDHGFERQNNARDLNIPLAPKTHNMPVWSDSGTNSTWGSKFQSFIWRIWDGPMETWDSPPRPIQCLSFLEGLPDKIRRRMGTVKYLLIFGIYLTLWAALWSKTLFPYLVEAPLEADGVKVISLTCGQAHTLWKGKNSACGMDAKECSSLFSTEDVIFRCPALCDRGSWIYSSRAVGSDIVKYRGYFIGGGTRDMSDGILSYPYRADSFHCGAAVHSGIISPFFGGCARVSYSSGPQAEFRSTGGHYGVSDSIEFKSFFPFSYVFKSLSMTPSHCHDPRLLVLIVNIILGAPVVFFAPAAAFYWTMAIVGFWTIVTATDPPVLVEPADRESFYQLISIGLERFLPTCFILYFLWMVSVKRTFSVDLLESSRSSSTETLNEESFEPVRESKGESPLSRLFLWYPMFWLGVLNNVTFDRLPLDRLTWHDFQVLPGALVTIVIISSLLVCCIVAQAYYVWLSGRFWKLLSIYGGILGGFFLLGNLPGLTLRIHHYIFGLVLIPGCATRGRIAYVFQGILLGLFLSGVARWGYASIAETNLSLLRGEPSGQIVSPEITGFDSGLLYWKNLQNSDSTFRVKDTASNATISLLVNDIERYRGKSNGTVDVAKLLSEHEELKALLDLEPKDKETPVFLRLAKYSEEKHKFGDYTRAAILKLPSFEFEAPPPGLT
ncbi:hypothetical protein JCM33374_g317 [Metschnikowia sp. JCM 33374]|nr:hypothetical protein JCM33374_g317 [Metschnikowia sp. JCM 33374]